MFANVYRSVQYLEEASIDVIRTLIPVFFLKNRRANLISSSDWYK
jgi:hypothetical protein